MSGIPNWGYCERLMGSPHSLSLLPGDDLKTKPNLKNTGDLPLPVTLRKKIECRSLLVLLGGNTECYKEQALLSLSRK